jgi:HEAT repeat protein
MSDLLDQAAPLCRRSAAVLIALCLSISAHPQTSKGTRQVPIESLIYDLKNPDPVRRREAAKLLGDNKTQSATPDLVAAASDADAGVRKEIIIALDKMRDVRSLPAFIRLSADGEKDIRDRSIIGMINLYLPQESGLMVTLNKVAVFFNPWSDEWADVVAEPGIKVDDGVVAALRDRLQDVDDGIRLKAARGLGILKGKAAVPALLETLRQNQTNAVRFEIMRGLVKIGDASAAGELMSYLNYNDSKVRNQAIYAIGRFRYREAVPEFQRLFEKEGTLPAKLIDKPYREALLDALAFIADPATQPLLLKEKRNPEDALRWHAVEGLARLADPSLAAEISRDWLNEKVAKVKTAQTYALYRMGRKEFLDELVNRLGSRKTNTEARLYLLELTPDDMPELYAQAKNRDANVREALAEILGLRGDERAIPVLQELAKDQRGQIAAFATQAIRRINARIPAS